MSASLEEMRQRLLNKAGALDPVEPQPAIEAPSAMREPVEPEQQQAGPENIEGMRQRLLSQAGAVVAGEQGGPQVALGPPQLTLQTNLPETDKPLGQRIATQVGKRNTKFLQSIIDAAQGEITPGEVNVRLAGNLAGSYFDALGEAFSSATSAIGDMLPDDFKAMADKAVDATKEAFLATPVGQAGLRALQGGIEQYGQWKNENPRAAENLESVVNVGLVMAPARVVAKDAKPSTLNKMGDALQRSAQKSKEKFVQDIVMPFETKKVREAQVERTKINPLTGTKSVVPSPRQDAMIKEVAKIPGIKKPGIIRTYQGQWNKISRHVGGLIDKFELDLQDIKVSANSKDLINRVRNTIDDARDNGLFIVGEGKAVAERLKRVAESIILENSKDGRMSPIDVLRARRQIDKEITNQRPNTWNENVADTAASILAKKTRGELNEILQDAADSWERVTGNKFNAKEKLNQQSLLLEAMDNIKPKAAAEYNELLGRAWQNAAGVLSFRNSLIGIGAVLGGTSQLGFITQFSAALSTGLAVGAVASTAAGLVTSRLSRQAMGGLLKAVDSALDFSAKAGNKAMVQQLRADRAVLIEILQNTTVVSDEDAALIPATQTETETRAGADQTPPPKITALGGQNQNITQQQIEEIANRPATGTQPPLSLSSGPVLNRFSAEVLNTPAR